MGKLILNGVEYINNRIDGYPPIIYSSEEREVGVWTDGKPLYQRTFTGSFTSSSSSRTWYWFLNSQQYSALNVDRLIAGFGNMKDSYGQEYEIPNLLGTSGVVCGIGAALPTYGLGICYQNFGNGTNYYSVTIQYTKTTDTPGSGKWAPDGLPAKHYSTTEQVVGTWIDGKPIYEKVYTGLSMSNPGGWITPDVPLYVDTCISGMAIDSYNQYHIMDVGKDSNGHVTVRFPIAGNQMSTLIFQYTKTTD